MAGIDQIAIGFTIAIIAAGVGTAFYMDGVQSAGPTVSSPVVSQTMEKETPAKDETQTKPMKAGWDRLTSDTDPGMGHEFHQLAIILPPSDNVYTGTLMYDASENIQLVSLRGPLAEGEEKGLKTWTTDGKTIFELTFVDPKKAKGTWEFSGNALAVHTMKTTPFIVDYKVDYTESEAEKTVVLEEEVSMQDEHADDMHEETMDEAPAGPQTHVVEVPAGTSVPGCEETNSCYSPADITINVGDTVEWPNVDTAAHTVTSGSPSEGPTQIFDSSLLMADATYAFTFEEAGEYDYFCMVHPWMVGSVTVN